jgi:hypothetical protein
MSGYLDSKAFGLLMSQGDEVAKIIGGLRIAVAQQRAKGV